MGCRGKTENACASAMHSFGATLVASVLSVRMCDQHCMYPDKSVAESTDFIPWPLLQTDKADPITSFPQVLVFSQKVLDGLRSVQIVTGTSGVSTRSLDCARSLFRSALSYRVDVFSTEQGKSLEDLVRKSKTLKVVYSAGTGCNGGPCMSLAEPRHACHVLYADVLQNWVAISVAIVMHAAGSRLAYMLGTCKRSCSS